MERLNDMVVLTQIECKSTVYMCVFYTFLYKKTVMQLILVLQEYFADTTRETNTSFVTCLQGIISKLCFK